MRPTQNQVELIVEIARARIGEERERGLCMEFVREIYKKVGIVIPLINPDLPPPAEWNLARAEVSTTTAGRILFLRNKTTGTSRAWTHVALTIGNNQVVHRSRFFGTQVVVSSLDEIFQFYDFVESSDA